jgi:hypothetical protein
MRIFLTLVLMCAAAPAWGHGIGNRYDLPLPFGMFAAAGALAVALSFVVAGWFVRHRMAPGSYPRLALTSVPPALTGTIRVLAVLGFLIVVTAGFIGAANPYRNVTPIMVWVIAWVGLAYICALLGNIWALVNPWRIVFEWAERLAGRPLSLGFPYPAALGTWPAVILFFIFAWGEINWSGSGIPSNLSTALVVYSLATWGGMVLFGRETWLARGEIFSIMFGLFARFSVSETAQHRLWLRPPAVGLIAQTPPSFSLMTFVLMVLSSVTYDGFTETEAFQAMALTLFYPLQGFGPAAVAMVGTIGLAGFALTFVAVYLMFAVLIWIAGGRTVPLAHVAPAFVLSLVPIAIAYHLSHYLSLLAFEGQNMIALVSDPFGLGWNLFGTADYRVDLTVMSASFTWYFSVVAIVVGHIAAVYVAHAEAMRLFPDRRHAFLSQLPMLLLMVAYTMVSLWIIAQPIVA